MFHRYLAICHPFLVHYKQSLNRRKARAKKTDGRSRMRLYAYTLTAMIVTALSNIPIFWEFETQFDPETQLQNITVTPMRINKNYVIFYKIIFQGMVLMLIPFLAILYFSIQIVYALVRKSKDLRRSNSSLCKRKLRQIGMGMSLNNLSNLLLEPNRLESGNQTVSTNHKVENMHLTTRRHTFPRRNFDAIEGGKKRNDMNLATVILSLAAVFLICNSGKCIVNIWEIFHIGEIKECMKMGIKYKVSKLKGPCFACK